MTDRTATRDDGSDRADRGDRDDRGEVETHVYLCTGCPLGCRLEVDAVDDDVLEVRGFACRRGERYGRQEHVDPRRPVATTVWIEGAVDRRAPVRTAEPVPRDLVRDVVASLRGVRLEAPVRRGDLVVADVCDTGIDVIVTRDLERIGRP